MRSVFTFSAFTFAALSFLGGWLVSAGCGPSKLPAAAPREADDLASRHRPGPSSPDAADHQGIKALPAASDDLAIESPLLQAEDLRIQFTAPVGPEAFADWAARPTVLELLVDAGELNDAALTNLASLLPNLEHLRLRLSPITDAGAQELTKMSQLQVINIPQSQISAAGIAYWATLPRLENVRLGGPRLDNAAMTALAALPRLSSLHLIGPAITSEGLMELAAAKRLGSLYIDDCPLPAGAWQQFKGKRPDVHLHLDQNHRDRLQE